MPKMIYNARLCHMRYTHTYLYASLIYIYYYAAAATYYFASFLLFPLPLDIFLPYYISRRFADMPYFMRFIIFIMPEHKNPADIFDAAIRDIHLPPCFSWGLYLRDDILCARYFLYMIFIRYDIFDIIIHLWRAHMIYDICFNIFAFWWWLLSFWYASCLLFLHADKDMIYMIYIWRITPARDIL